MNIRVTCILNYFNGPILTHGFFKQYFLHTIHVYDMLRDFNIFSNILKGISSLLKTHLNVTDVKITLQDCIHNNK